MTKWEISPFNPTVLKVNGHTIGRFWAHQPPWTSGAADAAFAVRAVNAHDALVEALKEITPPMLHERASCHFGICSQEECGQCGRIARAHAALALAEGKEPHDR
jgi:hypothetical protein